MVGMENTSDGDSKHFGLYIVDLLDGWKHVNGMDGWF